MVSTPPSPVDAGWRRPGEFRLKPGGNLPRMGERRGLIESKRSEIREIVGRHRGRSVSVFGSVARDEETATSDIDFLVEFEPGSSLFDLLHISQELEELLGVPVDVVSVGGLKERDDHIRREAVPL